MKSICLDLDDFKVNRFHLICKENCIQWQWNVDQIKLFTALYFQIIGHLNRDNEMRIKFSCSIAHPLILYGHNCSDN